MRRKSKSDLTKLKDKLWDLCKKITRQRYGNICYTCGTYVEHPHTGHFIPSSVCSTELRYSLNNLRPQCYACNIHKSGNWPAYEAHLITENGEDFVQSLKKRNQETKGKKYDVLWYQEKIKEYEALCG